MNRTNTQWSDGERQEVIVEALHEPDTAEERSAQEAKFRAWLEDERYRHLWPMLDRLNQAKSPADATSALADRRRVAS